MRSNPPSFSPLTVPAGALLVSVLAGLAGAAEPDGSLPTRRSGAEPDRAPSGARVRIGAYWWDGWFEGSPYIREPLITEFKDREPVWGWRDDSQHAVDSSIKAAARYGVDFFAFLWYPPADWTFPGGEPSGVMNNGLRFYLASNAPQRARVGFLLMVTRAPESGEWEETCRTWSREYLSHERYVRVEGRPALFFYELAGLERKLGGRERVKAALGTLRQIAREETGGDLFLVLRAQGRESEDLAEIGFDGATDYALADAPPGEHSYQALVAFTEGVWQRYAGRHCNYIPSVTSGWDGRPRSWMKKEYYAHWFRRSPAEFGAFVKKGLRWVRDHPHDVPKTPLLIIYAWNELDEGGAICPTKKDGARYLEALQAATRPSR